MGTEYTYDGSGTRGIQAKDGNGMGPIHAVATSANDKWMVAERAGVGLIRVNLTDNMMRLITQDVNAEYWFQSPHFSLAITNDAREQQ